jgi:bifunctional ADP-heptose synthase (sugar kinase/adenylyltransferase)
LKFLEQARAQGDVLVVGLNSDRSIKEYAQRIWKAESYPVTISCVTD